MSDCVSFLKLTTSGTALFKACYQLLDLDGGGVTFESSTTLDFKVACEPILIH
jgi:hypothetical protein